MESPAKILENVPLAPFTTLNVGGPAKFFARATNDEEVVAAFEFADERRLPVFVLGGGSNIVVADSGFDGLVVHICLMGRSLDRSTGQFTVSAGEDWDAFVSHAVEHGLAGIECLSGIPGLVGGTPVQNVGAYGQEVSETITVVRCYDRTTRKFVSLTNKECGFSYRRSIFNGLERDRYVVLDVTFALRHRDEPKIVYGDLVDHFAGRKPSLLETREAVLAIRRSKSMVIDRGDPNSRSVGSFFKNPIIAIDKFEKIEREYSGGVPNFPAGDGSIKLPAAWIIERAGFEKGFVHGGAGISTNHTLALINRGRATAVEIIELKDLIQSAVRSRFDIELVPEPVFIGDTDAKK